MADGEIKLRINAFGEPTIEAVGFTGTSCTEATAGIEKALSGDGEPVRILKPEFYEQETEQHEEQHQHW